MTYPLTCVAAIRFLPSFEVRKKTSPTQILPNSNSQLLMLNSKELHPEALQEWVNTTQSELSISPEDRSLELRMQNDRRDEDILICLLPPFSNACEHSILVRLGNVESEVGDVKCPKCKQNIMQMAMRSLRDICSNSKWSEWDSSSAIFNLLHLTVWGYMWKTWKVLPMLAIICVLGGCRVKGTRCAGIWMCVRIRQPKPSYVHTLNSTKSLPLHCQKLRAKWCFPMHLRLRIHFWEITHCRPLSQRLLLPITVLRQLQWRLLVVTWKCPCSIILDFLVFISQFHIQQSLPTFLIVSVCLAARHLRTASLKSVRFALRCRVMVPARIRVEAHLDIEAHSRQVSYLVIAHLPSQLHQHHLRGVKSSRPNSSALSSASLHLEIIHFHSRKMFISASSVLVSSHLRPYHRGKWSPLVSYLRNSNTGRLWPWKKLRTVWWLCSAMAGVLSIIITTLLSWSHALWRYV